MSERRSGNVDEMPRGGWMTLWVIWMTYGSFYFCRQNISVVVPFLGDELEISKVDIGYILASFKLCYAFGQFINGQLAERISPRRLLAIGMCVSALLNVCFGFFTGVYFLLFIWAANGYFQSLGWTPCMRVAANWYPMGRRGRIIGVIGTGYQFMAAVTYLLAGFVAENFGWRYALYIPAALLFASGLHTIVFLREAPEEMVPPERRGEDSGARSASSRERPSFWRTLSLTVSNPAIWVLAITLLLLNGCRYFFLDWGLTHLKDVQETTVAKSAAKYFVLPLGGIPGAFVAGWMTDRYFGGRRAPVIAGLLVCLGGLIFLYNTVVHQGTAATVVVLALIGFAIYGSQVLLVGTAPVDLARKGTPAAAVGFVNCMGYVGAAMGDQITPFLYEHYDQRWEPTVNFWGVCALVAAATVTILWNHRGGSSASPTETDNQKEAASK